MANTKEEIKNFISSLPEAKRIDIETLHKFMLKISPKIKLWFSDGRNDTGKVVANPTIGYGSYLNTYADGKTAESFKIGISANATGISVYILGIADKTYLSRTYGTKIGKATVTGYCIRFKGLKDLNADVLEKALVYAIESSSA